MSILYLFCTFLIKNSFLLFSHKVCDEHSCANLLAPQTKETYSAGCFKKSSHVTNWSLHDESVNKR